MRLTRRQEEFVENLIILSEEMDGPIHYSKLAERLGVSPFTAYDMLRLLEEKGMVTSEYHVAEGKTGPGRAERLFYPADTRETYEEHMTGDFEDLALTKEELRRFMLEKVRLGQFPDQSLAEALLARIPPDGPPRIRYCLEVLAVMALRLNRGIGRRRFLAHLSTIFLSDDEVTPAMFSLLAGFAYGLLAEQESADQEWSRIMLAHVLRYQEIVCGLDAQACRLMADGLAAVLAPLTNGKN